ASDAGFPVVSLLCYTEIADSGMKEEVLEAVKKSLQHELAVTAEGTILSATAGSWCRTKPGTSTRRFSFRTTQMPRRGGKGKMRGWRLCRQRHHWRNRILPTTLSSRSNWARLEPTSSTGSWA